MKTDSIENAVSPVVGVMLMLVVTIIIAAVVSAFAGSITTQTDKAPQVTISGEYSISDGLKISHMGGDPISTKFTNIYVKNSENVGTEYLQWKVNLSSVTDSNGNVWQKGSGSWGFSGISAGQNIYILPPYHEATWLTPESQVSGSYYNNDANIGKTFWVYLTDESGKKYAETEVTITK